MKTKQLLNLFFVFPFILISFNNIKGEKNRFKELEQQIDSLRVKYNVPAIAYGVVRNDSVIVKGVIG